MANTSTPHFPLKLYGSPGSSPAYTIRDFLHRSDVPFEYTELKTDEQARRELGVSGLKDSRLPMCLFADGTRMENPTIRRITDQTRLVSRPAAIGIRSRHLRRGTRGAQRGCLRSLGGAENCPYRTLRNWGASRYQCHRRGLPAVKCGG